MLNGHGLTVADEVGEVELTAAGVSLVVLGTGSGVTDVVGSVVAVGGGATVEDTETDTAGIDTDGADVVGSGVGAAGAAAERLKLAYGF